MRKSYLAMSVRSSSGPSVSYPYEKWFTRHLLHSLESQGVRKFVIRRSTGAAALRMWVFSPDLTISSSVAEDSGPVRVMKVMWQPCDADMAGSDKLDAQRLSEGDIELAGYEFEDLEKVLQESSKLLPESGRVFQDWRVVLLRRFTAADLYG